MSEALWRAKRLAQVAMAMAVVAIVLAAGSLLTRDRSCPAPAKASAPAAERVSFGPKVTFGP